MEQGNWNKTGKRRLTWLIFMISTEMNGCSEVRWQKKAMTGGGIQAKLWAENAVQYNRITIMQPVRVSGWMSGWMEKDGVLSSFHFNVFSNSLRIRSPYAPPLKRRGHWPLLFNS